MWYILWVNYVWKFLYKHFKETLITCLLFLGTIKCVVKFFCSYVTLFYLLFCIHLVYYKVCPWLVIFNVFQLPFSHDQTMTRFYSSQDINDIDLFEIGRTVSFQLTKTKSRGRLCYTLCTDVRLKTIKYNFHNLIKVAS